MTMEAIGRLKIVFLMPVYNDWKVSELLIKRLNEVLNNQNVIASIILINDGSTELYEDHYCKKSLSNLSFVDIINLDRNIGHQRAIAVGLTEIHEKYSFDAVIVMDADGEDKPEDIPRLINEFIVNKKEKIVFAERLKRSEGWLFRISYKAYQIIHYLLTGIAVKVGNFSILPYKSLKNLVLVSELWNHYAAAVFISKLPFITLPTNRGERMAGNSSMNFTSLVIHGLSAISVFAGIVGVRLLLFSISMFLITAALIIVIIIVRSTSIIMIPEWIFYSSIIFLFFLLIIAFVCLVATFLILMNRYNLNFIPKRDCKHFVGTSTRIYG